MGNSLFQSNYLDIQTNDDEGESSSNDGEASKKLKYNFYLDRDFLSHSYIDEKTKYIIKQKYAISKINLIIKCVKIFLHKKKSRKKIIKNFAYLLNQNILFKSVKSSNLENELNQNAKSDNNLIVKNKEEQNNNKIMRQSVILNSENFNKITDEVKLVKLGPNSYILGKLSPDKQIKYVKTFFSNGDILKSYYEKKNDIHFGIYNYYKMGTIYEGYWKEDKKNGIGIEKIYDGSLYEGEFKNGKKNGIGIYFFKDSSIYFGEWLNNSCHGYGVFKNRDKSKYQGQFLFNKRDGYGELIKNNNGTFYFGKWNNNKRQGFGVEFSHRKNENSKIYVGYWKGD